MFFFHLTTSVFYDVLDNKIRKNRVNLFFPIHFEAIFTGIEEKRIYAKTNLLHLRKGLTDMHAADSFMAPS